MYKDVLSLAVVDFSPAWGDKPHNLAAILDYMEQGATCGAELIVLPEMALTGYDDQADVPRTEKMQTRLAETIPGPTARRIAQQAKTLGIYAAVGMPQRDERDPSVIYNSALWVTPYGNISSYQKIHLPADEPNWASRGRRPGLLDSPWGPIGLGICYDTYKFPELIRYARARGARLFLNPTACADQIVTPEQIRLEIEAHTFVNRIYIASANLVGEDLTNCFMGGSSILGPGAARGKLTYYAGHPFEESSGRKAAMHLATIDLSICDQDEWIFHINPKTGTPDWRPERYAGMCRDLLDNPAWQEKMGMA